MNRTVLNKENRISPGRDFAHLLRNLKRNSKDNRRLSKCDSKIL